MKSSDSHFHKIGLVRREYGFLTENPSHHRAWWRASSMHWRWNRLCATVDTQNTLRHAPPIPYSALLQSPTWEAVHRKPDVPAPTPLLSGCLFPLPASKQASRRQVRVAALFIIIALHLFRFSRCLQTSGYIFRNELNKVLHRWFMQKFGEQNFPNFQVWNTLLLKLACSTMWSSMLWCLVITFIIKIAAENWMDKNQN